MKRTILAGALLLAATTFASAQSAVVTTPGTTVVVEPEQRTHIHKYITERHVRPVTMKERVSVGTVLPSDIELVAVPEDWGQDLHRYRYVYTNDHVVLVDPSSRRVVKIVE